MIDKLLNLHTVPFISPILYISVKFILINPIPNKYCNIGWPSVALTEEMLISDSSVYELWDRIVIRKALKMYIGWSWV